MLTSALSRNVDAKIMSILKVQNMLSLEATMNLMNNSGGAASSLRKHLKAVGIAEWTDITRSSLYALRDHLSHSGLATGTQKTVMAN